MTTGEQLGLLAVLGLIVAWLLFKPTRTPAASYADDTGPSVAPTQPLSPPPAAPPPGLWTVAPSTGPAAETRKGRGHF